MKFFLYIVFILVCFPIIIFGQGNIVCFTIEPNPNPNNIALSSFTKYVNVLDVIYVYAESSISDVKVLHVAAIIAELLDNNEDGIIDDSALEAELNSKYTVMPVFNSTTSNTQNI